MMTDWQSMDTAPHDRLVIICDERGDVFCAQYYEREECWEYEDGGRVWSLAVAWQPFPSPPNNLDELTAEARALPRPERGQFQVPDDPHISLAVELINRYEENNG